MCGIFGVANYTIDFKIDQVLDDLVHRGPDDKGAYVNHSRKVILGHTRLSIIDLSARANQPMTDKSAKHSIVYNGEIYNYKEIRDELEKFGFVFQTDSDTEVLLKSYVHWKEKCVEFLRGMFAFAIYDQVDNKLFLARDRFGIKPIYYVIFGKKFVFSSEITPMINSGLVPKSISEQGLTDYHYFGSVQGPNTIYEHIHSIPPSSYLWVDLNSLNISKEKYYDYSLGKTKYDHLSYTDAVRLIRERLIEATRYHLVSDVEVGAYLSGGVDSNAVVSLMARELSDPIKTFTISFPQNDEVFDEGTIAKHSAEKFNCEHKNIQIDNSEIPTLFEGYIKYLDQPSLDGFNTYIISQKAAQHVKVVLSGLGGDEIFAGYRHYEYIQKYSSFSENIITKVIQNINSLFPNKYTKGFEFIDVDPYKATILNRMLVQKNNVDAVRELPNYKINVPIINHLSPLQKISKAEIDNYLVNTLLRDADVMSMAHSLELRPILLDHILVETAFKLPDEYKIRNGRRKAAFVDAVKEFIPKRVYDRDKSWFSMPYSSWMNNPLREYLYEVFNTPISREIFTKKHIKNVFNEIDNKKIPRKRWKDFVLIKWLIQNGEA